MDTSSDIILGYCGKDQFIEINHPLRQFIAEHKMDYTGFFIVVLVCLYEIETAASIWMLINTLQSTE